jgi:hypothetical protein
MQSDTPLGGQRNEEEEVKHPSQQSSERSAYFHEIFILVIKCENAFDMMMANI